MSGFDVDAPRSMQLIAKLLPNALPSSKAMANLCINDFTTSRLYLHILSRGFIILLI